ncbi:MAG: 6-phospho-3-hexuloisomerase [Planctomycetaceae bacterium]
MTVRKTAARIAEEIGASVVRLDDQQAGLLVDLIDGAKTVFVSGAGRSRRSLEAFAIRLMHLGIATEVVGETTTGAIGAGDLLLVGSGSGSTGSLVTLAGRAVEAGGRVALVTIRGGSPIGELADVELHIPAPTPKLDGPSESESIQPMGSLFEQSLLVVLDAVVLELMQRRGESSESMFLRHTNLE